MKEQRVTRGLARLLPAAAVLLLAVGGCDRGTGAGEPAAGEPVLRRGNGGEAGTLDPARAVDIHAFSVLEDLYEGLVTVAADGSLVPGAAARWRHDADLRRFEFELREDARWSTGERVTSMDFVRGLRRLADPGTNAAYAPLLEGIRGYAAVRSGDAPVESLGISAPDPGILVIELDHPGHTLLHVLAMPMAVPVHASMSDTSGFGDPTRFVGNGPYRLVSRRPNDRIRLEANPHHRDVATLGYCGIEYLPVVDPATEATMYLAGELDITGSIAPQQLASLKADLPAAVRIAPQLGVYFIAFDTTEPRLDNRELRMALSMAIDRAALTAVLGRGEQPAWGLLPPGLLDADTGYDWSELTSDVRRERARELFRTAVGDGEPPTIRLVFDAGDVHERVALAVADMWRDVLGIETTLDKREWKYFLDTRNRRQEWDAMRYAWFADYADAESFLGLFRTGSEHNLPGFGSPAYDDRLAAARAATETPDRNSALAEAAREVNEAYAFAPLYYYVSKHLVRPSIRGFVDNALDRHPSRYLRPSGAVRGCARDAP